jgi:hypothetical protein
MKVVKVYVVKWRILCESGSGICMIFTDKEAAEAALESMKQHGDSCKEYELETATLFSYPEGDCNVDQP